MKDFAAQIKKIGEIGYVEQVLHSIVYVNGLPGAMPNELVVFETGERGQILSLTRDYAEIMVFSSRSLQVGIKASRTNTFLNIPVGEELLGQVINPFGEALDHLKPITTKTSRPVDVVPGGIVVRKRINKPLETGVSLVDLIIPLGKGQRELVIGDRKTGKTEFLLQAMLTQAKQGTICIYSAIGKKKLDIKRVEEFFDRNKIKDKTIIIASDSEEPASIIYINPYSAMTIAEYFRDQGKDVLIVLDDLLTHAKFYREISLLARRFPGRNSYPGDIFYTQAKLLERAGNFTYQKGESSITCLPVVETTQGDLGGYIQTNLMSMTDGHIYFDSDIFTQGRRPAINPFLSVTRVGRQTQSTLRREINRELVSFLTLYERMQRFVHFGAELSEIVKNTLSTGELIHSFFDQTADSSVDPRLQIFLFCVLWIGTWQGKTTPTMKGEIDIFIKAYEEKKKVREDINELISKAESFNKLLNDVRKQVQSFFDAVDLKMADAQEQPLQSPQPQANPNTQLPGKTNIPPEAQEETNKKEG